MPSMSPSQICLPSLPLPDRYGRGYIAVAVSVLHPGTLRFKPVPRSTSAEVSRNAHPSWYDSASPCTGANKRAHARRPDSALRNDGVGGSNPSCGTRTQVFSCTCGNLRNLQTLSNPVRSKGRVQSGVNLPVVEVEAYALRCLERPEGNPASGQGRVSAPIRAGVRSCLLGTGRNYTPTGKCRIRRVASTHWAPHQRLAG